MNRIPILDVLAAALLAVAIAAADAVLHPRLSGDEFTVVIGLLPEAAAKSLPVSTLPFHVGPDDVIHEGHHRLGLRVPAPGRFTVTGVALSGRGAIWGTQFWVDGTPIRMSMLDGVPHPEATPLRFRPIARHVALRAGDNELYIPTLHTGATLILRFQEQSATEWGRAGAAGAGVFVGLLSLSLLTARVRRPVWRLAGLVSATLLISSGVLGWIWAVNGSEIIHTGNTHPKLNEVLSRFDRDLERFAASPSANKARVFTFGDSTHSALGLEFKDALAKALERDQPGEFAVFGLMHEGMSGRDYYSLVNKIIGERPDVLVLPITLPTFERTWYENPIFYTDALERFVRAGEIPRAMMLRVGHRRFKWDHILLRKADAAWFGGRGEFFLGGLHAVTSERVECDGLRLNAWLRGVSARNSKPPTFGPGPRLVKIDEDDDMVGLYREIAALARRHGARVVYYLTPIDEDGQNRKGNYFLVNRNFWSIERAFSGQGNVTLLDLHTGFPKELMRDDFVHLHEAGIQHLADRVARTIEAKSAGAASRSGVRR